MHDIVQAESFRWSHLDLCFFRNQDTQQHFTQRRYIGFIQACLWLEGNIAAANLLTCIDFEWTKSSNSVQCWIMSNRPTQKHTNEVSVQQSSYSPGTTGLWTWDQKVLRRHPSFSSVWTPAALPTSPKQEIHKHSHTHIEMRKTNQ